MFQSTWSKFFIEDDAHFVQKVGIKCFRTQQAEMSLMSANLVQSEDQSFFMNTTHAMFRKLESSVLVLSRAEMSLMTINFF